MRVNVHSTIYKHRFTVRLYIFVNCNKGISYVFLSLAVFPAMSITYNDHKCLLLIDRHYFGDDFEDDDGDICSKDTEVCIAIGHLHRVVFY